MSVKTRAVGVVVDADDLAAEALAKRIRDESKESVAVARCQHGDYVVMPYSEWRNIQGTSHGQGLKLELTVWAQS